MSIDNSLADAVPASMVVLGLGNPVLADDAVGLRVATQLEQRLRETPLSGIVIEQSTRGGFELLDLLHSFSHAVIIDALFDPAGEPGEIRRLSLADVRGSSRLNDAHGLSLDGAFKLAERMGISMPSDVLIYGVVAGDITQLTEELSGPVEAAVDVVVDQVWRDLTAFAAANPGSGSGLQKRSFYDPAAE